MSAPQVWSKSEFSGDPLEASDAMVKRADREFRTFRPFFEYRPDPKGHDIWQRCRLVKIDGQWKMVGDCEDGCLDLCIWFEAAGISRKSYFLAVVSRAGSPHAVVFLLTDEGFVVYDLLDRAPWELSMYPHSLVARQVVGRDDVWLDLRDTVGKTLSELTIERRLSALETRVKELEAK
jgi:hypothetical protein